MKKILFVLAIWGFACTVSAVFTSCEKKRCGEDGPHYANISSLNTHLYQITGKELAPYGGERLVFSQADSSQAIKYDSLLLTVTHNYSAMNKQQKQPLLGISAAYACSPVVHYENVREFIITSTEDYDTKHPAGTNLADIILLRIANTITGMTIEEFLQNRDGSLDNTGELFFSFNSAPVATKSHIITIKYNLTNGKSYVAKPVKASIKN